jgi:predicted RNase H-like nuclease (RuvC/YqgF family)
MDKHGVGRKLLQLKERLNRKKQERAELKGEYNSLLKQLEQEFKITEVDEIDKYLQKSDKQIISLTSIIEEKIKKVEILFEEAENDSD